MALAFELVAEFAGDKDAAESCRDWLGSRIRPVQIDQYSIKIHPPYISGYPYSNPTRFQLVVLPANVGCGVSFDKNQARIPLTDAQLSYLGSSLYDVLRGAPGYCLAMVGWDVDFLLDVDELAIEWASDIRDGSLAGLVVLKSMIPGLPKSAYFVDFDGEHVWIPYRGSKAI